MRPTLPHFIYILFIILFASCDNGTKEVDTSAINVDLNFKRFEVELFALAKEGITKEELRELEVKFPMLYPLYVEAVMGFGAAGSEEAMLTINKFVADTDIKMLVNEVMKAYPLGSLESKINEIEKGFKHFKYYFPEKKIPEVKTLISAFTYNTVVGEGLIALGIDTYLGGDFEIYPQTNIPKYKFEKFAPEFLVSDALKAWIITEFDEGEGKTLLEEMIFQGKILYLVKQFLPNLDQPKLFNYFEQELSWCEDNEADIWFHFVDMELLYTAENHQIQKYLGDAPFIAGFPEGSPGRVGQWIGFQIVDAYMDNNSDVSLQDLMNNKDANNILQQSKYKPRR